ncbi:hypothetical protein EA462_06280 [Natrarchaeobius halalkaliphilus]|uniref:Uncharacterized protein n=1 Tax=Natrarchaeobius halalkaliphilus TaxID=1679091 RepID=A0A3N6M874_9EURY|nr:hypothetical protein [Natrarchaeobius halalkaliphilus]RQG91561.1 hypothetical protein EA462_06280 [Natrarchaeobius halalkaliphilus]
MNKHFHDSLYYLKRAGEHAKLGVESQLEPAIKRVRERLGNEPEPEQSRLEAVRSEVAGLEERTRGTIGGLRERVPAVRSTRESTGERNA